MEQQLILDRYRPLEELGEGASGVVTLAWDTRMQRRVAIKRLDLPAGGLAEARTAAMLSHPNIVTVFDFDADDDEAFLVMEYVDGASLAEILDEVDGRLEADEAASMLDDLTEALAFAHDNGVLHLDIKPENVLVARDGRAKVADFGIARLSSASGHGAADAGTYGYMPLEQLEGRAVTERTDEWALAALMNEALTGENPFAAPTPQAAAERVKDLSDVGASQQATVPAAAADALAIALSVEPAERYTSVGSFADALAPHLGDAGTGRASLAEIVADITDEERLAEKGAPPLGVWDRAGGRAGRVLVGLAAAVQAAWLVWAGLTPLALAPGALAAATALVALGSLLAPSLGIALGLGCLSVGLFANEAWAAAIAVPALSIAWWWFIARRSHGAAVLPFSAPIAGAVRLPLAHPLICGFALPPVKAAITALLGGILAFVASAASAQGPPYALVRVTYIADVWSRLPYAGVKAMAASPAAYIALLGWPLAAAVMSVFSARATRAGAFAGAFGGTVALTGAYLLAEKVAGATGARGGYAGGEFAAVLSASLILVTFVIALGAPIRGEDEGLFYERGGSEDD